MPLAFKAARYPSLSYPLSPIIQGRVVWERGICKLCTDMIAHLTFTEAQDQRSAISITHRVQALSSSRLWCDRYVGEYPFFKRLAAVRCTLRWVASIIKQSSASLVDARAANILSKHSQTAPADEAAINRLVWTVCTRRITPAKTVPDYKDNPAQNNAGHQPAVHRAIRRNTALSAPSAPRSTKTDHSLVTPPWMKPLNQNLTL